MVRKQTMLLINIILTAFLLIIMLKQQIIYAGNFKPLNRALLTGPTYANPQISPNGKYFAYIAPKNYPPGLAPKFFTLNLWVQDTNRKSPAKVLTDNTSENVDMYFWAENNQDILYLQESNGNEQWQLHIVNIDTEKNHIVKGFQGKRVENIFLSQAYPQEALVFLNMHDPRFIDVYRLDLKTGEVKLKEKNPGNIEQWYPNDNFQILAAIRQNPDGSRSLIARKNEDSSWRTLVTWSVTEEVREIGYNKTGDGIYIVSTLGSNTEQLQEISLETGKVISVIATNEKSDISNVLFDKKSHTVQAVLFDYLKPRWLLLDKSLEEDFTPLQDLFGGSFEIVSRDLADEYWIIKVEFAEQPIKYYLYDRNQRLIKFLFHSKPELAGHQWLKVQPLIIKSRDGLNLISYLTLPPNKAAKNLPLILFVHGGPWLRDSWNRFNRYRQWFASLGYAVLQVNYRGSTGFGKKFLDSGNGEWGRKMQDDLTDAVNWAIDEGIADPKKVCIIGGSYGGYAVLAGLTFTPDLYACGVAVAAPTNLNTLVQSFPPDWALGKFVRQLRIGDVINDSSLNYERSPIFHVSKIRAPLLLFHGKNDPRVGVDHAASIEAAMKENEVNYEYVAYDNEGHTIRVPGNRLDMFEKIERFLAKELGEVESISST